MSVRAESRSFFADGQPLPWQDLDPDVIARLGTDESGYDVDHYAEDLVNDYWGSGDTDDEYDQYED